ncbi:MAG TPA: hypothetical protein VK610_01135 [Rhodothermales bacterium]|nr:hypothetical protein [Rhodothermales bacterium]
MPPDDLRSLGLNVQEWQALSAGLAVVAVAAFLIVPALPVPAAMVLRQVDMRPRVTEVTITQITVIGDDGGAPAAQALAPRTAEPPAPRPRPEPRRTPPARPMSPAPVRIPETPRAREPRPNNLPPAAPVDRNAPPRPPAPPPATPDPTAPAGQPGPPVQGRTDEGGVSETGAPGSGGSQDGGGRGGTGGGSGVAYGGLGNRGIRCRTPAFPGYSGTVSFAVTFDPSGRYVSSRAVRRAGNTQVNSAASAAVSSCRAEALAEGADQVNQVGSVTFSFSLR